MEAAPLFQGRPVPPLQQLGSPGPAMLENLCHIFHRWPFQDRKGLGEPVQVSCTPYFHGCPSQGFIAMGSQAVEALPPLL